MWRVWKSEKRPIQLGGTFVIGPAGEVRDAHTANWALMDGNFGALGGERRRGD